MRPAELGRESTFWVCREHFKYVDVYSNYFDLKAAAGTDLQTSDTLRVLPDEVRGGGAGHGQRGLPFCRVCNWVRSLD